MYLDNLKQHIPSDITFREDVSDHGEPSRYCVTNVQISERGLDIYAWEESCDGTRSPDNIYYEAEDHIANIGLSDGKLLCLLPLLNLLAQEQAKRMGEKHEDL